MSRIKGSIVSEEVRRKISLSNKGHKHTEEWKKKHSEILTGKHIWENRKHPRLGVHNSEETRIKQSIAKIGKKRQPFTEEWKKKLSEAHKGKGYGSSNPMWKGGISYRMNYSRDWTETLKRSMRERDEYICQMCGVNKDKYTLEIHHIDYDKKNCNPTNLITLCKSCHTKTSSNREYWENYFKTKNDHKLHQRCEQGIFG